jgi:hypothetical protein
MTGLGVERTPRAAYRSLSTSSTGVSAPLPPHIQEAERRTDRRARRTTGSRWGLRVLVVGGLAGAAWLLTGAAAQAADRTDGPVGSLLGSVVGSDTTAPVTGILKAAAQPLEAARPAHDVVADVIDVPRRVLTRPVETIDEVVHGRSTTPVDTATGGVDQVMREVAGPDRLTGGPANAQQRLTTNPDPAAERPHEPAVAPVQAPVVEPVTAAESPAPVVVASRAPISEALPVHHHRKAHSARSARRAATAHAVTVAGPETATAETPGGDGPAAPLRLHLGDVSGTTSTSGSPTPTEGGSAAFLPAAIASSTMACHPLPIASDVEVRCPDAEAPTVSPD